LLVGRAIDLNPHDSSQAEPGTTAPGTTAHPTGPSPFLYYPAQRCWRLF